MLPRLLVAVLFAAAPMLVQALGLGRFVVHSGLDEPLNAQIELISPSAQEIRTLKTTLASREDFDIAGVERGAHLFDIKYAVSQSPNGQYYLKLTTDQPIREPFLHFLIQAEWSGGRLIREYSTLLDPPHWVAGQPAGIDVPETVVSQAPPVEPPPVAAAQPEVIPPYEELPPLEGSPEIKEAVAAEKTQLGMMEPAAPASEPAAAQPAESVAGAGQAAAPAEPLAAASDQPSEAGMSTPPAVQEMPALAAPVAPQRAAPESTPVMAASEYGPVKSGDTLSQIAQNVTPDRSLTAQQVMIALLRANPAAFIDGNVNHLKTGKILTVPERETIAAIPRDQASREFRVQYDAWQEYKLKLAGSSRAVVVAEAETAKPEPKKSRADSKKPEKPAKGEKSKPAASGKAEPVDLLRIVRANLEHEVAEDAAKTPGVETSKDAGKEQRALSDRVATLEEAIESKQMQNQEMRDRVGKLQEGVKNTERLIDLENKQLAQAQKQAAEKQAAEAKAAQELAAAQKLAQEKAAQEKAAQEKAAQEKLAQEKAAQEKAAAEKLAQEKAAAAAAKPAPAPPAEPTKPPVVAKAPVAPAPPAVEGEGLLHGILTSVTDNNMALALIGAFGVLAAGVTGLYAYRRRRASREFSESILSGSSLTTDTGSSDTTNPQPASDTSFLSDFSQGGMGNVHTDEVDPIAEAEVYLAYGRDEQAEEILKDAVVKDPARQELKGKLLEIYFQRNDVGAFETLAEELYAALEGKGGKVWEKAEEMGRKLSPNNPMFRGGKPQASAAAASASVAAPATTMLMSEPEPAGRSMPSLDTAPPTQTLDFESPAPEPSAGIDFNMNLDSTPAASEQPAGLDMAFDLGSDAGQGEASSPASSGFDMDFSLDDSAATPEPAASPDTSNLIDFNVPSMPAASPPDSGLDFSLEDSTPSGGGGIDFPSSDFGGSLDTETATVTAEADVSADASLPGWDETATKLDLAKAYIDMGDSEGARSILDEVISEGNDQQKQQARDLASQIAA